MPPSTIARAVAARPFTFLRLLSSFVGERIMSTGEAVLGNGSREIGVLKHIYDRKNVDHIRGNPTALVDAIDKYAAAHTPLMTIGPQKRDYIIDIMSKSTPGSKVFVEVGAYVGYSTVALAAALRDLNKGHPVRYISLEMNPINAAITTSFAELAGLKDVIQVHVATAGDSLTRLTHEGGLEKGEVDFMLVDHWQSAYLSDLKLCEQLGIFKEGSVIVADNVIMPGAPDYLAYVRKGIAENSSEGLRYETKTEEFETPWGPDQLAISTVVRGSV